MKYLDLIFGIVGMVWLWPHWAALAAAMLVGACFVLIASDIGRLCRKQYGKTPQMES